MAELIRAAAYCRVSTDREDQANSLTSQRKYFTDYIGSHAGWTLAGIYYDEGISGTQTRRRDGFNAMMADARSHRIDLILTKEVSRFARNTVDALSCTRRLRELGIGVIFTLDNIDTREADGELRLTLMASLAQEESRKTSQRVKWGQRRRMEQGVVFGRDLLGYTVSAGQLTVKEEEAAIVRAIFHKYTDEGKGTTVIARELLSEGMSPMKVPRWSAATILKILRNEKYVGDLYQKKTFTPDYLTHRKQINRGQEEMIKLTDHHTPIIDRALWERTQAELLRRAGAGQNNSRYSSQYWCSGKILCGCCGGHCVSRRRTRRDGGTYQVWRCSTSPSCGNISVHTETLTCCLDAALHKLLPDTGALREELLENILSLFNAPQDASPGGHLEREVQRLQEKKRRAVDLLLEGSLTPGELRAQRSWYDTRIRQLEHKIKTLPEAQKKHVPSPQHPEEIDAALREIVDFEGTFGRGKSRESAPTLLYREVLDHMTLHPNHTVEIRLNGLTSGMKVRFRTGGQGENYWVEILNIALIPEKPSPDDA